ncbi:MAG: hypothetical protein IKP67_03390 [Spirochaetales bacterium]|nr:hypothetical protein [Spirochaetales bacterium]
MTIFLFVIWWIVFLGEGILLLWVLGEIKGGGNHKVIEISGGEPNFSFGLRKDPYRVDFRNNPWIIDYTFLSIFAYILLITLLFQVVIYPAFCDKKIDECCRLISEIQCYEQKTQNKIE